MFGRHEGKMYLNMPCRFYKTYALTVSPESVELYVIIPQLCTTQVFLPSKKSFRYLRIHPVIIKRIQREPLDRNHLIKNLTQKPIRKSKRPYSFLLTNSARFTCDVAPFSLSPNITVPNEHSFFNNKHPYHPVSVSWCIKPAALFFVWSSMFIFSLGHLHDGHLVQIKLPCWTVSL